MSFYIVLTSHNNDKNMFFRWIIARRVFFVLGTLYIYRTITMLVTTLPVPGAHFHCAPKVNNIRVASIARLCVIICVLSHHHLCFC